MTVATLHPEDIKAELRKRHRTVHAFAAARGLKAQAVADWLRGRTSAPVAAAIAAELGVDRVEQKSGQSIDVDDSNANHPTHRLNAGGK